MSSFWEIAGLVRVMALEVVAMFCFSSLAQTIWVGPGIYGCPPNPLYQFGVSTVVMLIIGVAAAWWVLRGMFRPRLIGLKILDPIRKRANAYWWTMVAFTTTSPWYLLIDVLPVGYALLFRNDYTVAEAGCGNVYMVVASRALLAVALAFPVLRLFAWYVLRLRPDPKYQAGGWKQVAWFWAILSPFIVFSIWWWVHLAIQEHRLPVVDAQVLAGGLAAHPNLAGAYVRLRGTPKSQVINCDCKPNDPHDCARAAVLLDLGAGGEVVVHGDGWDGIKMSRRLHHAPFEQMGQLMQIPDRKADKYEDVACGFDHFPPPSPIGRAYLRIDSPF